MDCIVLICPPPQQFQEIYFNDYFNDVSYLFLG